MTLEEAIEINQDIKRDFPPKLFKDKKDALQLGIEALKRVKAYKEAHIGLHYEPMLGETME